MKNTHQAIQLSKSLILDWEPHVDVLDEASTFIHHEFASEELDLITSELFSSKSQHNNPYLPLRF